VTPPVTEAIERDLAPRFRERLRVFATRRLGDAALAEDLAQEVLRRVTEALRGGRVENLEALPGFVFQTATHLCLHHYRSRGRETRALARLSEPGTEAGAGEPTALDRLVSGETRTAVRRALDQLTAVDRDLLRRIYFDDEDGAEIATRLGITAGALRVRKHRALTRLAGLLGEWRL
jgi:RNA polymerase sigma-70 factor (ECF subfamily)